LRNQLSSTSQQCLSFEVESCEMFEVKAKKNRDHEVYKKDKSLGEVKMI